MTDLDEVKSVEEESPLVNKLYQQISTVIGDKKVTSSSIVNILLSAMQIVEKCKKISGEEKKSLVLKILKMVIDDTVDDQIEASNLKLLVDTTLPVVIDTLVSVDKKELHIKIQKCFKKLFSCYT